jgi:hypothetical protein
MWERWLVKQMPTATENNSSTQMYQIKMAGVEYQTAFKR